ncbi:MAG TPA: hydrolase [Gammaproteobacteria bacterium]|nr:hydrolase [Gammaproteobacteria bacterium]
MITQSTFRPAWWLKNRHAQTIFPTLFRRRPKLAVRRERLELPDGDFADCDWVGGDRGPIVIVLHGLEGSIDSSYATGIMALIDRLDWRGVLLHFRGCSGEPNRLAAGYHSGFTNDLDFLVTRLHAAEPDTALAAIGFSLGGNVLLKWLGERGASAPLATAVAVSVPFDPATASDTVEHGLSRIYNWYLLRSMRRSTARKFRRIKAPVALPELATLKTFRQFDDAVTAPLHGFRDAADYYRRSGSRHFLRDIRVPTLILQSQDDPVVGAEAIPAADELAPAVTLELSAHGGHVGFVSGRWPWKAEYWLEGWVRPQLLQYLGNANVTPMETRSRRAAQSPPAPVANCRDNSAAGK